MSEEIESTFVGITRVLDPETGGEIEIELFRIQGGAIVGLDSRRISASQCRYSQTANALFDLPVPGTDRVVQSPYRSQSTIALEERPATFYGNNQDDFLAYEKSVQAVSDAIQSFEMSTSGWAVVPKDAVSTIRRVAISRKGHPQWDIIAAIMSEQICLHAATNDCQRLKGSAAAIDVDEWRTVLKQFQKIVEELRTRTQEIVRNGTDVNVLDRAFGEAIKAIRAEANNDVDQ